MWAFISLLPDWVKLPAAGLLGALVVSPGVYLYGKHEGRQQGREAALQQSVTILKQKAKTDAEVRDMSDADLCRSLGGVVSDDGSCE